VFDTGYLTVGRLGKRYGRAPIRLHWTLPVGMLVFTRFHFVPGAWAAFGGLVLLHELGHAFLVRRARMQVMSVDVHGFGGSCQWYGVPTPTWRAVIAWGGVLAQGMALLIALPIHLFVALPPIPFVVQFVDALVWTNLTLIVLNLLPIPPLDGAQAWPLVGLWLRRRRTRRDERRWRSTRLTRASSRASSLGSVAAEPIRLEDRKAHKLARAPKHVDDVVIDDAEAERLIKQAIREAQAEAEKRRREGRLH
jgi:hypothetical protein